MVFEPREYHLKNGDPVVLRSAEPEDAKRLLLYLRTTAEETPFLLRDPDEIRLTEEEEISFIRHWKESDRHLMLLAEINGIHAGNASFSSLGPARRTRHRCSVALALYKQFWGLGLGRIMLSTLLEVAEQNGYKQAELQVCTANTRAVSLYKDLGFVICGSIPRAMIYQDESSADEYSMVKQLGE